MSISYTAQSIIILTLLFLSALFSSLETAIASSDELKFRSKASSKKNKLYNIALAYLENTDDTISRILILNNIVNSIYATIITIIITKIFGIKYLTLSILLSTLVLFVFGEMFPKLIASIFREKILTPLITLSYPFIVIIKPISKLFYKISNRIANAISREKSTQVFLSEDDVKSMVKNATSEGNLEKDTKELIERAFDFDDKIIHSIMQPWKNVVKLEYCSDASTVYSKLKDQDYTRLPVIDETGVILGVYNIKKFLQNYYATHGELDLKEALLPPFYLDWNNKIDDSLKLLSQNKVHMAFVKKDEKIVGIVTIEDILEELVGEIEDEEE